MTGLLKRKTGVVKIEAVKDNSQRKLLAFDFLRRKFAFAVIAEIDLLGFVFLLAKAFFDNIFA